MLDPSAWRERGVDIVHSDRSLLVLYKPPGLPTTSPDPNEATLVHAAHALDPDAPRLHPSSRLDAEVSGLVTFARTPEATKYLLSAREQGSYCRAYVALAAQVPAADAGELAHAIGLDPRDPRKRRVVPDTAKGARPSRTRYRVLTRSAHGALLWLEPLSGRTHQLRVHLAHIGCALLGDRAYGGATRVVVDDGSVIAARRVMLHCFKLSLPALAGEPARSFERLPPEDFARSYAALSPEPLTELLRAQRFTAQ